ncbi:MAG: 4-deoxy-4-formamido-L-arabinose-phosphoundecaprenol deformylase [Phycisphaerales bacterium]|nr:4-deoxy-4-formamido-L-arabinose-phosphoundecaprenol deformylase [Phycisphaerales bacterium]
MRLGLRIDVDTFRGTRDGVPALRRMLNERGIKASFFFTVGPDNMGRHVFRLLRPTFLRKMLRTRAGNLYGWNILFRGTIWPGPMIGSRLASTIRGASDDGHEIGVHAWDHHRWQMRVEHMSPDELAEEIRMAHEQLKEIIGSAPDCSAVAGWRCTDEVLEIKAEFPFRYNSDCRGTDGPFMPRAGDRILNQPQVPVSLPTWDEVAGQVSDDDYNEYMLDLMRADHDEVLTIHAEAEGMSKAAMFADFLDRVQASGREVVPLGSLIGDHETLPTRSIDQREIEGREGWVAVVAPQPGVMLT